VQHTNIKSNHEVGAPMGRKWRALLHLDNDSSYFAVLWLFLWHLQSFFKNWIGKATYVGPAKMVSINVKHRHNIEIKMIQHFSHDWVTPVCKKGLKDKRVIFLMNGSQIWVGAGEKGHQKSYLSMRNTKYSARKVISSHKLCSSTSQVIIETFIWVEPYYYNTLAKLIKHIRWAVFG
jgi:hypothetical protein